MKQLSLQAVDATKACPVRVQPLLGGRFIRVTIYGPQLETCIVLTADQLTALAEALATSIYYTSKLPQPLTESGPPPNNAHAPPARTNRKTD